MYIISKNIKVYSKNKAHIALIAMTIIYSINYHISSNILQKMGGYELTLIRVLFAAAAFSMLEKFIEKPKQLRLNKQHILPILLAAFLMPIASQLFFFEGLKLTNPVNASIMRLGTPLFVLFLAPLFIKTDKLSLVKIIGVGLAVIGAYLTIKGGHSDLAIGNLFSNGDFLVLLSAAAFGGYTIIANKLMKQGFHTVSILKWSFVVGAIILLLLLPFERYNFSFSVLNHTDISFWLSLVFLLVFATMLTFLFNISALKTLSTTVVGTYTCLQPVGTIIIGLLLGQAISNSIIAGLLVLVGVLIVSLSKKIEAFFQKDNLNKTGWYLTKMNFQNLLRRENLWILVLITLFFFC